VQVSEGGGPATGQPVGGQSAGDERLTSECVRALYEVHGHALLVFLTGVLRDAELAQDVCQITFQRLLEVGHGARLESIRGWLFKVGFHEALASRRKAARFEKVKRHVAGADEPGLESGLIELVRAEDVARIRELVTRLPPEQQAVVRMRIHEGKTFATIADELRVPIGTVLTRMRLALEKLQKWFGRD